MRGASRADGSSLFGLLMIVVVMGVLGATAVVGVSSLTGGGSSNIPVVHTATSGSGTPRASRFPNRRPRHRGYHGSRRSSGVPSDGRRRRVLRARSTSRPRAARIPRSGRTSRPSSPSMFSPATNVTINAANPNELDGRDWKIVMSGGGATAPTFTCR